MSPRAMATGLVAVVLLVGAATCLSLGLDTSPSTGGLLVAPVELTRVVGGWVAAGVALATAGLLCLVDVIARTRAARGV